MCTTIEMPKVMISLRNNQIIILKSENIFRAKMLYKSEKQIRGIFFVSALYCTQRFCTLWIPWWFNCIIHVIHLIIDPLFIGMGNKHLH